MKYEIYTKIANPNPNQVTTWSPERAAFVEKAIRATSSKSITSGQAKLNIKIEPHSSLSEFNEGSSQVPLPLKASPNVLGSASASRNKKWPPSMLQMHTHHYTKYVD